MTDINPDQPAVTAQLTRKPDGYELTVTRTRTEGAKTITEVETGHYDRDGILKTTDADETTETANA